MNNKLFLEFDNYVKKFDLNNELINNKYKHSYRVYEYSKIIANSLKLSKEDISLAMTCGLLHDIGRFEIISNYNELWDHKSVDHGDKGYEILKENNFITKFTENDEEKEIILFTTKNHNKYKIEDTSERYELFANIVRDADKLDIMITQFDEIKEDRINKKILEELKQHKMCNNQNVTSDIDMSLRYLSFIFDINYKRSFEIIMEENIIEKRINIIKEKTNNEEIDEIKEDLINYVKERLK